MIELPEFKEGETTFPKLILFTGVPGVGKSSLIKGLNQNGYKALHIDLQSGANQIGGHIFDVKKIAEENGWSLAQALKTVTKTVRDKNIENGSPVYDFVCIDPLSLLKGVIVTLGTKYYNESIVGKAAAKKMADERFGAGKYNGDQLRSCFSKDVVADIGQNGWNFYGMGWKDLYSDITTLAGKSTIIIGHTKYNTFKKTEINEVTIKEIDFWPSYLLELVGDATDSASLYRKGNEVIASFILNDNHAHFKSRHFDGKEIVLSTKESNDIKTHWEQIFPFLTKKK